MGQILALPRHEHRILPQRIHRPTAESLPGRTCSEIRAYPQQQVLELSRHYQPVLGYAITQSKQGIQAELTFIITPPTMYHFTQVERAAIYCLALQGRPIMTTLSAVSGQQVVVTKVE